MRLIVERAHNTRLLSPEGTARRSRFGGMQYRSRGDGTVAAYGHGHETPSNREGIRPEKHRNGDWRTRQDHNSSFAEIRQPSHGLGKPTLVALREFAYLRDHSPEVAL